MSEVSRPALLRRVRTATGARTDVRLAGGRIAEIGPDLPARPGEDVRDLSGYLLLPGAVEPHAHLDKALLGERAANPAGDLAGAIAAIRAAYPTMGPDDVRRRAGRALTEAVHHGYRALRTHVDCRAETGTGALRALAGTRTEWSAAIRLEVVALAGFPITGPDGDAHRKVLLEGLEHADVVGGVPALDPDPAGAVDLLARLAAECGLALDLHTDETTDPDVLTLRAFAAAVDRFGLGGRATASHCVSLGRQNPSARREIARLLADAGVAVVTLPQTNLYLQGRNDPSAPRGLTAVRELLDAGVTLAGGGDNWRDPFNPLGRIDPFETAALLVAAGHLGVPDAWEAVSAAGARLLGLPAVSIAAGSPADLFAVRADSLAEAVAAAPADRICWHAGTVVAETRTVRPVTPVLGTAGQM